jgi:hypothetical protein
MSTVLKFRRGNTSTANAFTGAEGELFVDTSKDTLVVHDGVTLGGNPLATESYVTTAISGKVDANSLSTVATSGSYTDLTDKPIIPNLNSVDEITFVQSSDNLANITTGSLSIATASAQQLDSFNLSTYRSAKYTIQATSGSNIHTTEYTLIHNDTNTFDVEYGTVYTNSALFTVDSSISSNNIIITVTALNNNTTVDFIRTNLIARPLDGSTPFTLEGDLSSLSGTEDLSTGDGAVDLNS